MKIHRTKRFITIGIFVLVGLCASLTLISTLSNLFAPKPASAPAQLTDLDKLRLEEVIHLRQTLGGEVLPDWDQADIPLILFNQEYIFLVGYRDPPAGWRKVAQAAQKGGAWEVVPDDEFLGQPYYRQKYEQPNGHTQAFTVQIGDRWAASMTTFDYMRFSMTEQIRQDLPAPLNVVLPYRWFVNQLIPGSDTNIGAVLHEAVHAYQGIVAADRLVASERIYNELGDTYPVEDELLVEAWQVELDLLNQALLAGSAEEAADLARQFLSQRAERRAAAGLSPEMIDIERTREWEEGIAKYGELSSLLLAGSSAGYTPLDELSRDAEFHQYTRAQQKWAQEIEQIRRMASDDSDSRFYYSGFAQAVLLDRLSPGWKARLFDDDVWLEDLLAQALGEPIP